jgi:N6-adenosine-specific RNA methylase IME4
MPIYWVDWGKGLDMDTLMVQSTNLPANIEDLTRFVLVGREKMVSVRAEIRAINKLGLGKEVRQQKLDEGQMIADALLDAEVRLGELMREIPKSAGGRPSEKTTDTVVESFKTKSQTVEELGFNIKQAERFETLAKHPEIVAQAKAEAREAGDIVSRSFVLEKIKAKAQQVKTEAVKADIERQREEIASQPLTSPDGLFDVIAIDPPWNYGTQYDAGGRRVGNPYPEMTQSELLSMKVPSADNAIMFLWTTQRFIWDAKELLSAWGFEYRNVIVWDKQSIGMGDLFRMQCEFCLVGIKGKPTIDNNHAHRDIIQEQRREHSRKPDAFYKMVDELCVGRKLDFFSRQQRDGWVTFGNETNKF